MVGQRLKGIVYRAEHLLPGVVFDNALPWRRRIVREAGVVAAPRDEVRLLIGPENAAGQGYAWARAAETLTGVSASCLVIAADGAIPPFEFDHHVTASSAAHGAWQRAQERAVREFSHVLLESGKPLFGRGDRMPRNIDRIERRGGLVALVWHGSDIRDPALHAEIESDSPFPTLELDYLRQLEERVRQNTKLARQFEGQQFVSTPDLLADVPGSRWLPVVVEAQHWLAARPPLARALPLVVHAPSRGVMKGSALIADGLRGLRDEGPIEYREATGLSRAEMRQLYGTADIVLDQFAIGSYGVAAVEAMAAGRVVVGHVRAAVRESIREITGEVLPIVQARAAEVPDVIRTILSSPETHRAIALRGIAYAQNVHCARAAADALEPYLHHRT